MEPKFPVPVAPSSGVEGQSVGSFQDTPISAANAGAREGRTVDKKTTKTAVADSLIDKEWVDRAKLVVRNNKANPYLLQVEITQLQAEYLQSLRSKDAGHSGTES